MNILKWLRGEFTCRVCGDTVHLMTFGFGECICPNCYTGEDQFLFPDSSYWLKRILIRAAQFCEESDIPRGEES